MDREVERSGERGGENIVEGWRKRDGQRTVREGM